MRVDCRSKIYPGAWRKMISKRKSLPRKPWSSSCWWINIIASFWSLQLSIPQKRLGSFYSFMGAAVQLWQSESCFKGIFPGSDLHSQSLKLKATSAFPRPLLWLFILVHVLGENQVWILVGGKVMVKLEISSEPTIDFQAGELLVLGSFFLLKFRVGTVDGSEILLTSWGW